MSWQAGSARMVVWEQLRLGPLTAKELKAALPGMSKSAAEMALWSLKAEGYAELLGGRGGRYALTDERPPLPAEHSDALAVKGAALDLVNDCPAGIDAAVLSAELKVAPGSVDTLLAEPIAQRLVRRTVLPSGMVRYLPAEAAA